MVNLFIKSSETYSKPNSITTVAVMNNLYKLFPNVLPSDDKNCITIECYITIHRRSCFYFDVVLVVNCTVLLVDLEFFN